MSSQSRTGIQPIAGGSFDIVGAVIGLPVAIIVSLLPARSRQRWQGLPLVAGTFISALLEIVLVLWWLSVSYRQYAAAAADSYTIAMGAAHYVGFITATPAGLIAAYGLLESLIRMGSAVGVGEPLGTLPLWILDRLLRAIVGSGGDDTGPLCRDVAITRPDRTLEIRTCKSRWWDVSTTLEYRGAFYQFTEARETDDSRRPFLYRFEPVSRSHLIRHIHRYSPDELL